MFSFIYIVFIYYSSKCFIFFPVEKPVCIQDYNDSMNAVVKPVCIQDYNDGMNAVEKAVCIPDYNDGMKCCFHLLQYYAQSVFGSFILQKLVMKGQSGHLGAEESISCRKASV